MRFRGAKTKSLITNWLLIIFFNFGLDFKIQNTLDSNLVNSIQLICTHLCVQRTKEGENDSNLTWNNKKRDNIKESFDMERFMGTLA
jgi:hypothetical protein